MDKEMRENIERLGQAERMLDEEKMSTKNISGIIEVNEDIEDQLNTIEYLERKLKNWNKVFWSGFVVLIIILLYMLYYTIFYHTGVDEPAPVLPNQVITEVNYFYKTDVPQIDKNTVEHINLHDIGYQTTETITKTEVVDPTNLGLIDGDNSVVEASEPEVTTEIVNTVESDYIYAFYMGKNYNWLKDSNRLVKQSGFYAVEGITEPGHNNAEYVSQFIIPNDTIYFWDSLVDVFNSQQRNIVVSDTDLEVPSLNREFNVDNGLGNVAAVCIPEIVGEANFLKSGAKGNTFIYSSRTAETFGGSKLADFIFKYDYTVTCYDGVDENAVKSAIQSALASNTYNDVIANLKSTSDEEVENYIMNLVKNAVASVSSEYSITLNSLQEVRASADTSYHMRDVAKTHEIFSTCNHLVNEKGEIVIGVDTVPEKVTVVNITDYEIIYDELACAYHYGWY